VAAASDCSRSLVSVAKSLLSKGVSGWHRGSLLSARIRRSGRPDFRIDIDDTRRIGARPDDDAHDLGNTRWSSSSVWRTMRRISSRLARSSRGTEQFADAAAVARMPERFEFSLVDQQPQGQRLHQVVDAS
jgi:hypothetical protein